MGGSFAILCDHTMQKPEDIEPCRTMYRNAEYVHKSPTLQRGAWSHSSELSNRNPKP